MEKHLHLKGASNLKDSEISNSEMSLGIWGECVCIQAHMRTTSSRLCAGLQKFAVKFIFLYLPTTSTYLKFKAMYLQTETLDN